MVASLKQGELASRLAMCTSDGCSAKLAKVGALELPQERITILDTIQEVTLPSSLRNQLYSVYKHAKRAFLKSGGDFPYLSRFDQINLHLLVHLRNNSSPPAT